MFNDWLELLKKISKNNYLAENFICPECGQKSIKYVYVGDPTTHIEFGDLKSIKKIIPDFRQIAPGDQL